jgi:hypothetical protein
VARHLVRPDCGQGEREPPARLRTKDPSMGEFLFVFTPAAKCLLLCQIRKHCICWLMGSLMSRCKVVNR